MESRTILLWRARPIVFYEKSEWLQPVPNLRLVAIKNLRYPIGMPQAELPYTKFKLEDLLHTARSSLFPNLEGKVGVLFSRDKTLANIRYHSPDQLFPAVITINSILNHADTPIEVIEHIIIHELLHLEIRPRTIEDKKVDHPPEFWEREKHLSSNSSPAMSWIFHHFFSYLKIDKKAERIFVKKKGYSAYLHDRLLSFNDFIAQYGSEANSELQGKC